MKAHECLSAVIPTRKPLLEEMADRLRAGFLEKCKGFNLIPGDTLVFTATFDITEDTT